MTKTDTPSDWRRVFAGHASEVDAYRISVSPGFRGSFVSPEPDEALTRVMVSGATALKCSAHGALIPSDMADAVHDQAIEVARQFAERKHITKVRYRVELLREGERIAKSTNRTAPLDPESIPEDDEAEESAKELRSMSLLRHADRQIRELHRLNLEQAERYVQLAEQHGAAVQSYNQTLLGMVHTIAEEREAAGRPTQIDPEVAREGIELARQFLTMQAARRSEEHGEKARSSPDDGAPRNPADANGEICRSVLRSLDPLEHEALRVSVGDAYALLVRCATDWDTASAIELRRMVEADPARFLGLGSEIVRKLRPLGQLDLSASTGEP